MQIEGDALAGYGSSAAARESLLVEVGVWGEVKLLLVGPSSPLDRIQHLEFWLVLPIKVGDALPVDSSEGKYCNNCGGFNQLYRR